MEWLHAYGPGVSLFPVHGRRIGYLCYGNKKATLPHGKLILTALKRTVILLLIPWITQLIFHPDGGLAHLRLPGVLPRIALVYFICTILYLKTSQKTSDWIFAGALIGYFIIMTFIPVPGVGYANLEPETNMGAWIDRLVFTTNHLWSESHTWDPKAYWVHYPLLQPGLVRHQGRHLAKTERPR
jgi:predicted acyltransferase